MDEKVALASRNLPMTDVQSILSRSPNLTGLIESRAARNAGQMAIADGQVRVTWAQLAARVARLAGAMAARGVGPGDRVALLMLDSLAMIELILACGRCGAIALPLNWRLAPAELGFIVDSAEPKLLFHSECFAALIPEQGHLPTVALPDAATPDSAYEQMVATSAAMPSMPLAGNAPLFMLFTSGTTGRPKGCLQSHAGAAALGHAFALHLGLTAHDRLLSTSPLFHVGGLGHVFAAIAPMC
jgi:acyl-CoA synthetase (AMP-forming)/AMP-acid ligase II